MQRPFVTQINQAKFTNKGAITTVDAHQFSWGDCVTLQAVQFLHPERPSYVRDCPAGSILRSNLDRARRSQGTSTHSVHDSIYNAFRSATHTVGRYGADGQTRHTEDAELEEIIQAFHEYVSQLFWLRRHFPHVLGELEIGLGSLAASYRYKVDEHKQRAHGLMWRGLEGVDSLGRSNPGAQRYAIFGAANELRERQEAVQWLSAHVDIKAARCLRLINEHMELFEELWNLVCVQSAVQGFIQHQTHGNVYAKLHALYERLGAVKIRPFINFAAQAMHDLELLMHDIGKMQPYHLMQPVIDRLREGTRWVFARNVLEMEIIFPLSILIERLKAGIRSQRRRTGERDTIVITDSLAPGEFKVLAQKIFMHPPNYPNAQQGGDSFEARLGRIKDSNLRKPKRALVEANLALIRQDMSKTNWLGVRDRLNTMAKLI